MQQQKRPGVRLGPPIRSWKDLTNVEGLALLRAAIASQEGLGWGLYVDGNGKCALGALSLYPPFIELCAKMGVEAIRCAALEPIAAENDKFGDAETPQARRDRMLAHVTARLEEEQAKERELAEKAKESVPTLMLRA